MTSDAEAPSPGPGRRVIRTLLGNGFLAVRGKAALAVLYNIEIFVSSVADPEGVLVEDPPGILAFFTPANRRDSADYVGSEATLILEDSGSCPWECIVRNARGRLDHRGDGPLPGTPGDGRGPWARKASE